MACRVASPRSLNCGEEVGQELLYRIWLNTCILIMMLIDYLRIQESGYFHFLEDL